MSLTCKRFSNSCLLARGISKTQNVRLESRITRITKRTTKLAFINEETK